MTVVRPRRRLAGVAVLVAAVALVTGTLAVTHPWSSEPRCPAVAEHPDWSVARRWDEALLDAIRRALPNPPVHARNLFHTSVAMWDAWAAYDPTATGYIATEKAQAADVPAARAEAISYAAFRVLTARYIKAVGGDVSLSEFDDVMDSLCYPIDVTTTEGSTPAAVGNRIAAAVLAYGKTDGSNEAGGYSSPDYRTVNPPLVVDKAGTTMADPNRWQPLQIEHMISQNGIPVTNGVQQAVGPHWGHVKSFAMPDGGAAGVPIDPGPPPRLGDPATDQAFKDQAVEVIRDSSMMDPTADATIDISPGARGGNPLGTNDGHGHPVNPATGQPYPSDVVNLGDFARVMAEFWADGPKSETPPGHWNVLANLVSDELSPNLRIGGSGPTIDRLQWDVKLYLALNGAVHDAAIAAWGLKGDYDGTRPISMIRYMGGLGQSSDPNGPSYNKEGLPLVPGLIEVVTRETTAPGQRHAALAGHEGEIAVHAWAGNPKDPEDPDRRGHLDPRRQLGPLPAADLRDAGLPGLHLRAQHLQPGRRRGPDRVHRQRVLPGRDQRLHDQGRVAQVRDRADDRHPSRVGHLLRRRGPGRAVAAVRRDPRPGRRLHRPDDRLRVRQGGLGQGAAAVRRTGGRMTPRARRLGLAAAAVVVVGAALRRSAVSRWSSRAAAPARSVPPRFIDETATAGVEPARTTAARPLRRAAASPPSTATTTGGPTCTSPAGAIRRRSTATTARSGGALRFSRLADPATDLTAVTGAYPLDIDGDGKVDLVGAPRSAAWTCCAASAAAGSRTANAAWAFDGGTGWTTAFSATWEGSATLPTLAVRQLRQLDAPASRPTRAPTTRCYRPDAGGQRLRARRSRSRPATARCRCCSATGTGRAGATCGSRNDRHYYIDGEEQLWRVAPGEPPRLYTEADGWVPMQIWGMGIASYDMTGDGYPEVFLTSQGDNKLQTLDRRPEPADVPRHRPQARRRPRPSRSPAATSCPSTAWHPEFEDVNNDGFVDLFVTKGNVERAARLRRARPEQPVPRPARRHVRRGGRGRRDRRLRRAGAGAALADFNLDGLLDLVVVNRRRPSRCGATSARATRPTPAPMGHWLGVRLQQPGPNRRRDRGVARGPRRRRRPRAAR